MDKIEFMAMRRAIKDGNIEEVKKLFYDNPSLINEVTPFGTWLQMAAAQGNVIMTGFMIECGIDINKCGGASDGGPINSAAANGHLDVVKLLIEKGAVLDTSTAAKNPVIAAIYDGHYDVVKYLVEKGIDITATYEIGSIKHCDACEYARQYGRTEIYNYLKNVLTEKNR